MFLVSAKMRLNCSYVLGILGKNSLIKKCLFVLKFTETRLKLFLNLGTSEARVLQKVALKKSV